MPSHGLHTFYDLQQQALRWLDESSEASGGVTRTFIKDALNRSHRRLLTERPWAFLRWPNEETLTTTAGTRAYALKPGVSRILTLWDSTQRQYVPLIPRREWEAMGVDRTEQLRPAGAVYGDVWPVAAQPSSATTMRIVSSSASDGAGETVILTGLNSSGEFASETLTANGTSQVTSSTSFAHLLSVTKTGDWAGTLTLSTSGGTTLLSLSASETAKQYPTLEFVETPDGAYTYTWTAQRFPSTLSEDRDIPDTPYPFSELHVYDALLDYSAYNTEIGAKEQRLWQARRDEIRKALDEAFDEAIVGSRPRFVRDLDATAGGRRWVFSAS